MKARSVRNLQAALALFASFGLCTVSQAQNAAEPAQKKEDGKDTVKLEKFEVTGSRVKRLDVETPAPVVAYKTEEMEAKGYTNIGDFIQSLPFNAGASNSIYQTASFTRGAATANPRGLGSQRFLTLVDGRRPATYALPTGGNRQVFDFNSLPAAAIDSVEFLKDGASAIYGADALTGVFNIKLKKNYVGLSTTAYYGNTIGHDTGLKEFSLVAGAASAKTSAMVAVDFKTANSNFLRDYDVTTTDYTLTLGTNKGLNQNSTLNYPANITINAALASVLGVPASGTLVINGGRLLANPTLADFSRVTTVDNVNRYNFANVYQRYPAYDYLSAYAQMDHEFNENVKAFGTFSMSDNRTYLAFTPGVINFPTEGLTLPVNNPYNPFGIPLTTLLARTSFGPVRKFDVESISANMVGGLRGTFQNWDWETAVNYGFNEVTTVSRNAIRATTYQAALNGTLSGFSGVFLNPFGPSDQGLINALFTSSTGMNKGEGLSWDASITNGSLFSLPAGDLGVAAGVEYRNDRIQTNPDTAAYLGSGGGSPLKGERDVMSAYVEVTAPIIKNAAGSVEAQVAARYEDYSDFGDVTKPKIGLKYRLPDTKYANVILRGSYSESFQAPSLALLYASQTVSFSSGLLQDPLRPQDPPQQQRVVTGGNPKLLPEEGETYYGGVVVEIPAIKELSFTVDYFKFKINQVIVTPSATFLLSARGLAQFPNAIVRDGAGGPIVRIESVPSNNPSAYQTYRGVDFGVNYRKRNTRFGDFTFGLETTRLLESGSDSGLGGGFYDAAGLYGNPKWRANANVGWRYKDYGANIAADYLGKNFNDGYTVAGWGENPYTLIHASVSYRGFLGTTITLGANNLFDNLPPENGRDTGGFDGNLYGAGALGRFVYVRVRKDF
jgi:outer membrane receptor protein involved in Fe transport